MIKFCGQLIAKVDLRATEIQRSEAGQAFREIHSNAKAGGGNTVVAESGKVNTIHDFSSNDSIVICHEQRACERDIFLDNASLTSLLDMAFYARGIDRGATSLLIALDQNASYGKPEFRVVQGHSRVICLH